MEGLVLEVVEADGRAPARYRLEEFPVTLGRAVDNTVVLDDPEVSAHHACIERDPTGRLVLRDLRSANGIFDYRTRAKVSEVVLSAREKLKLGGTTLRVRGASETLERTVISQLVLIPEDSVFSRRWVFPTLALTAAGTFLADEYLSAYRYPEVARLVFEAVALLIGVVVWTGFWSVLSKQLRRTFHFFEHGGATSAALIGLGVGSVVEGYVAFSSSWPPAAPLFDTAVTVIVLGWLAYKHLGFCSAWNTRRLKLVSALVAVVMVGTASLYEAANAPRFRTQPAFPRSTKPPAFRVARSQSIDEFFDGAKGLAKLADDAARRD